jgi:hypothetical protein
MTTTGTPKAASLGINRQAIASPAPAGAPRPSLKY